MALSDTSIRNAKSRDKPYKLGDSGGLYLLVQPSGGKLWRLKYRIGGKERKLSIGRYPDISLVEARRQKDEARQLIAIGRDPSKEKQLAKFRTRAGSDNTFAAIGREYLEKRKREGIAESTLKKAEFHLSRLTRALGRHPIEEVSAPDLLVVIKDYEKQRKHETARRLLQLAGRICRYAVATARLRSDPTRDLRGALTNSKVKHFSAILDPKRVGELLRAIDGYEGMGATKFALQLAPHVFVRPGELRKAEWDEIDFNAGVWTIPSSKTKMRRDHHVPLSNQSIRILREAWKVTGPNGFVFPSVRTSTRPMSENTVNAGLRRLGFSADEMTAHGFRAMASTFLNESGEWNPDAIERALAHGDSNKVRAAYHRGTHWEERVAMAQWWSDYLDALKSGAQILPFHCTNSFQELQDTM